MPVIANIKNFQEFLLKKGIDSHGDSYFLALKTLQFKHHDISMQTKEHFYFVHIKKDLMTRWPILSFLRNKN